ncbi:type I polyketide synthase [Ralstonia pseudosolanacearum]|uniref:type I polyketide synthase n=1 Tax=Ralstonia pseudosolanacearum TaxID=1310165 RepID=UPI002175798B|nr:type I polyketide synthase [Ralstonia pseudosolanacearum]UWD88095.1 acyltransferase domain-containing protein [Ralstonia pseudosolanacearum]
MQPTSQPDSVDSLDIAVIGMAGRFPGANNVLEYWENLKLGVESIRFFSESESLESGISPEMLTDPNFVAAGGPLEHEYDFDAEFFDFNPRDAEITDPQQRLMLECAWEALESAGYDPQTYDGRIGIYAGNSLSAYFLYSLLGNPQVMASAGLFQLMTAADKDFLATRAAYKLGLTGPAMTVQTACSTSLVAINMACQSLLSYQSDIMLAGGSSITPRGRVYAEGFMFSPDGKCRAFDTLAQGTVCGNGVGLVVLKRLADALADGDHIHAVIKGTAVNNDGMRKVGISAPSVSGQAEAILDAQTMANVDADTITYIESHGTGTQLGDPIEIAALTQAFRSSGTERTQFCAIGSTKPNIGHLDTAAGVAGLIKAVLSVEHAQLAPSLHFTEANPKLDLENSPFFINAELRDWKTEGFPRRAGVSAFGFGGTNAHTILEQAPDRAPTPAPSRDWQLLPVSGRDEHALRDNMRRLGAYLESAPAVRLTDVAHTLQVGRRGFAKRAYVLARNTTEAAAALTTNDPARIVRAAPRDVTVATRTVFMFSGQGSQHIHMCRDLFEGEPLFRTALVEVAGLMRPHLDIDLLTLLYPRTDGQDAEQATATLNQTRYTQPALFAVEYALARLWMAWGIQPEAMIGHSIGEYVAACLAGVLTLADAARLVCLRGKLIQEQAPGAMLSVPLGEQALLPLLTAGLSLAAVNAPALCVVSGDTESIEALRLALQARGIEGRRLHVSHAFHSHMLDAAARAIRDTLRRRAAVGADAALRLQRDRPVDHAGAGDLAPLLGRSSAAGGQVQRWLADAAGGPARDPARSRAGPEPDGAGAPAPRQPAGRRGGAHRAASADPGFRCRASGQRRRCRVGTWRGHRLAGIPRGSGPPPAAAAHLCVPAPALLPASGLPDRGQRVAIDPGPCPACRVGQAGRSALRCAVGRRRTHDRRHLGDHARHQACRRA